MTCKKSLPSIRIQQFSNCVSAHSGWCPFWIVSIRDGVHSGWYPFGIVSIRDCVHTGWCCLQPNTKCPAKRTRPSIFQTNNPEIKIQCLLIVQLSRKSKTRTNSKSTKINWVRKSKNYSKFFPT